MLKKIHKEESKRHYAVPKTVSFLQLIKCTAAVNGFRNFVSCTGTVSLGSMPRLVSVRGYSN